MLPTQKSAVPAWLLACLLAALALPAAAGAADTAVPASLGRGQRMAAVEAAYGAPAQRYPAVGRPPISRWDYPGFVVFFENDRVIHAVRLPPAG